MLDLTTVHGALPVWPASTSGTTTPLPRRQCSSTPRSLGESFHCRTGSNERAAKRARLLGARDREPQLDQVNAGLDELRSHSGCLAGEVLGRAAVAQHAFHPARLYQDRSNCTVSPPLDR